MKVRDMMTQPPCTCSSDTTLGMLSIDDIVLWGVQEEGVTGKAVVRALHSIWESHQRFHTDAAEEPL